MLILNRNDPNCQALAGEAPGQASWFSSEDDVPGASRSRLRGEHNRANMAAAAALARALKVDDAAIERAIGDFAGVPYRQELIRVWRGIEFVNDSAATTPDATMAALRASEKPVVLIAGGADKDLDFQALGAALHELGSPVKAVVLLEGSATSKVAEAAGNKVRGRFNTLAGAVHRAVELAAPGDVVLLSPGCASFGMFAHEFDRGDQFNALVRALS